MLHYYGGPYTLCHDGKRMVDSRVIPVIGIYNTHDMVAFRIEMTVLPARSGTFMCANALAECATGDNYSERE